MTQRSPIDLPALDEVLRKSLSQAQNAGKPPASVVLSVLTRGHAQSVPTGQIRVWLRSRAKDEVRALVNETYAWRALVKDAARHAEVSPSGRRLRVARLAVASLLRGCTPGENALIVALLKAILDDPNGWDSTLVTRRLGVTLGVTHASVSARVKKLGEMKVLTIASGGRGVTTRVRFRALPRSIKDNYRAHPAAVALVDALVAGEETDDVRLLFAALEPSVGYSDVIAARDLGGRRGEGARALLDAVQADRFDVPEAALDVTAWSVALLSSLDALETVKPAQIRRAKKTLKSVGLGSENVESFADIAADLSEGLPTALRDEAEERRRAYDEERTVGRNRAQSVKDTLYATVLPPLYESVGNIPKEPTREWLFAMQGACVPLLVSATSEFAVALRSELRKAMLRRGWSGDQVKRAILVTTLPSVYTTIGSIPAGMPTHDWLVAMQSACVPLLSEDSAETATALRTGVAKVMTKVGWSEEHIERAVEIVLSKEAKVAA